MAGVSSRTRSKNIPLFGCIPLVGSSKRRMKKGLDSVSGSKKRKVNDEPFVVPKDAEVVSIDDDEEGSEQYDEKMFEDGVESGDFDAKDEKCGRAQDNPITICSDEYDEENSVGSDADNEQEEDDDDAKKGVKNDEREGIIDGISDKGKKVVDLDDSDESDDDDDDDHSDDSDDDESEENETSDEDFKFDELNEISDNDDDSSSDNDGDSCSGSYVKEKEEEKKKKGYRKDFNVVEDLVREVKDKKSGISEGKNEEVNVENSPSYDNDDDEMVREGKDKKSGISERKYEEDKKKGYRKDFNVVKRLITEVKDRNYGISERNNEGVNVENHASVFSSIYVNKGSSSSKLNGVSETMKAKSVEVKVKNVSDESVNAKSKDNVGDSDEGKNQYVKGLDVRGASSVQTKQEKTENKGRNYNICYGENKKNEVRLFLAQLYQDNKKNTMKNDSIVLEVKDDGVDRQDAGPPPVSVDTPHERIWSLKKVEIVQKTKEDEERESLWEEFDTALRESDAESMIGNLGTSNATQEKTGGPSSRCEHDTFLDEEIGLICKLCRMVVTEIKYISPPVIDSIRNEGSRKRGSFDDSVNASLFDGSQFNVSDGDSDANFFHKEGTVWDLIPDVKQTLYPHQKEGFEFIWKNLAGNIELQKLKNADPRREGGCIISHAPGTGKTRLTIVFLKAYLKVFPRCLPIIVAPANLLLTWEDEFKKWDIGVPFHNLNKPELSVKEHDDVVNAINWSNTRQSKEETRMVKLISWFKDKSILGISYSLYEKLAGGGGESENSCMRKVLLKTPGLLVLDEGHTPRNKKSLIWKVLSKMQTPKRIILSGTPFQNNFLELYNTLSLVKPSFPKTIPQELKKFCQKQEYKKVSKVLPEWSWEPVLGDTTGNTSDDKIKQLKLLMDPFVHVHKGAILQKKLLGLRDCVLRLKPDSFHKQILESFKSSQNSFIFENKQTLASIHPSLFLECKLLKEEESVVDKDRLEKLRLDHNAGVKTKFLVEFVSLCAAQNEKVLVFSQFLSPLRLIIDQLNSALKWTESKEILYMYGEVKDRQSLINNFNDANSQAKILLASTRACSEGISLVGASRVVLLDVEWNPSVEKQAISRAYRIGQKKFVYTYHLLTQGTKECDKYCKQAEKHRLSELVFSAKNADHNDESKSCAANIEDKILDLMIRHKNLKDMFVECVVQPKEREFESFG